MLEKLDNNIMQINRKKQVKSKLNSDKDLKGKEVQSQQVSLVTLFLENMITQLKRDSGKFAFQAEHNVHFTNALRKAAVTN